MKEHTHVPIINPTMVPEDNPRLIDIPSGRSLSKLHRVFGPSKRDKEDEAYEGDTPRTETNSG